MKRIVLICVVVCLTSVAACAPRGRNQETTPAVSANGATRASSTNDAARPLRAPDISSDETRDEGAGTFNQYKFSYRRTGNQVTAKFAAPKLPWRDSVVVAAAREIIVAAYDDRSENFPRRVEWNYEGTSVNAIKLEGDKYEYVFLPIKDEATRDGTKEVASLVFWRLNKGTAK